MQFLFFSATFPYWNPERFVREQTGQGHPRRQSRSPTIVGGFLPPTSGPLLLSSAAVGEIVTEV